MIIDDEDLKKREARMIELFAFMHKKKDHATDWEIYFITKCWGDLVFKDKAEFDEKVKELKDKTLIDTDVMTIDTYPYKEIKE